MGSVLVRVLLWAVIVAGTATLFVMAWHPWVPFRGLGAVR
jgi:hypothetical protein